MMRKAVAQVSRRKNRKERQQQEQQPMAVDSRKQLSQPPVSRNAPARMTPDEAALTAKNYRLAKELVREANRP